MFIIQKSLPQNIGMAASTFQYEVGIANLIFTVLGITAALNKNYGFRSATIIGFSIWLWGDALKHFYLVAALHTKEPYYNGPTMYIDAILPILGITLLLSSRRRTWMECCRAKLRHFLKF